jgi:lipopolysaccharide transport system ATP-binding protein
MEHAIRTEGLSKSFRIRRADASGRLRTVEKVALHDVDLRVEPGEVLGLIGRNGAGKSTLLRILSRITAPTRGRAWIRGRVAALLEVGTGMHPDMTGRENVFLNGALLGMGTAEIRRKFDEIVDFSGVEEYIDTPLKHYSSGMRVRLGFAVAACLTADILIVDEVLAVGDAEFQAKCLGTMSRLAGSERTVLFVSHNLDAVRSLCGLTAVLEAGALEGPMPTGEALDRYIEIAGPRPEAAPAVRESGGLRLEGFELRGGDGVPLQRLESGGVLSVRGSIRGSVVEPAPVLILRFSAGWSDRVAVVTSRLGGITLPTFGRGIDFRIDCGPLWLMPRTYDLHLALRGSRGSPIAEWEHLGRIEVASPPSLAPLKLPPEDRRGYVHVPAAWTVEERR